MHKTELTFPDILSPKQRHVIHEICEELNLKHESHGAVAERVVSVFKGEVAQGHNLSRAVYGCVYYEDGVDKPQHVAYLRSASPSELEVTRQEVTTLVAGEDIYGRLQLYKSQNVDLKSLKGFPVLSQENIFLVQTEEQLEMASHSLLKWDRISFDAEWHSYRSYFGISCTIQLAAGDGVVFVIDCLACWNGIKRYLGPLFENPRVIKVGLALQQDVQFLLRDFGIVTRGAFDLQIAIKFTEQASNVGYASVLASCGCDPHILSTIEASKTCVRGVDWRRRPLTVEMILYASNDTYYLLPCHDILAHRLVQMRSLQGAIISSEGMVRDALTATLEKAQFKVSEWSKNKGYRTLTETRDGKRGRNKAILWRKKYAGQPSFGKTNERVLEALYTYREHEAWKHDESLNFIASADLLFHLSWKLPITPQAVRDVISTGMLKYPERDLASPVLPLEALHTTVIPLLRHSTHCMHHGQPSLSLRLTLLPLSKQKRQSAQKKMI